MILVCIDGTGAYSDEEYQKDMRRSYANRIRNHFGDAKSFYYRGPSLLGTEVHNVARAAYERILKVLDEQGNDSIAMVGYSRGGVACLEAAELLNLRNLGVFRMLLLDAVGMALTSLFSDLIDDPIGVFKAVSQGGGKHHFDMIPDNVQYVTHFRRLPAVKSRPEFVACGVQAGWKTTYREKYFRTSHGGMGVEPWSKDNSLYTESRPAPLKPYQTSITNAENAVGSALVWGAISKLCVDDWKLSETYLPPAVTGAEAGKAQA